jgi:hypothetical protein
MKTSERIATLALSGTLSISLLSDLISGKLCVKQSVLDLVRAPPSTFYLFCALLYVLTRLYHLDYVQFRSTLNLSLS